MLLVLTAAGLWAWNHWVREPRARAIPVTELQAPALRLWAELTPGQRSSLNRAAGAVATPTDVPDATSATVPASAEDSAPAPVCASLGPFDADAAGAEAEERLSALGYTAHRRTVPGKVRVGYWVFLPEYVSRSAAEAVLARLKARGVKDLYVVADSAHRNAISLGVYSEKGGAQQRAAAIRSLGFKPQLSDRFRDAPVYWLDIASTAGPLPELSKLHLDSGGPNTVRLEVRTCPGGTVAGEEAKP